MARHDSGGPRGRSLYLERRNDVLRDLDPRLQERILQHRDGEDLGSGQADVIVRLHRASDEIPAELEVGRQIDDIVTGSVAVSAIETVRRHRNVASLKAAAPVSRMLDVSVREIRSDPGALRQVLGKDLDGSGVIVGIVDQGCAFQHDNFRHPSGGTRILSLWDQRPSRRAGKPPRGFRYGRELTQRDLDEALRQDDPYDAIGYRLEQHAHGTHVMDIAAGNGRETGAAGVAPGADLIFVHLAAGDLGDDESLGDSRRLLEAVDYIFSKADELGRPAVVNLSLGTHGGPHDGSTPVEQGLDRLLNKKAGRAIVIAAGNSRNRRSHASGLVTRDVPKTLTWQISETDLTPNEVEIWYEGKHHLEVTLIAPDGTELQTVLPGETHDIREHGSSQSQGWIIHREKDPNNKDHQINIFLQPSLPRGSWRIRLSTKGDDRVEFHAWIERDDNGQSRFAPGDVTPSHTLGSICCGELPFAVGAYAAREEGAITSFSAQGPTRKGRQKPEVSAPGEDVIAADSFGGSRFDSGTSMAAPHVTGLIALLFQAAAPQRLPIQQTRKMLLDAARPANASNKWDPRYGKGRVDAMATLRALSSAPLPAPQPQPVPVNRAIAEPTLINLREAFPGANNGHEFLTKLLSSLLSGRADVQILLDVKSPEP